MLVTVIVKVSDTDALLASVLVTVMLILPTWSLVGVPLSTPVAAVKVSQLGSSAPPSMVAVKVEVSPVSTSAKVELGITRLKLASSAVETSLSAALKVGASLLPATLTVMNLVELSAVVGFSGSVASVAIVLI